MQYTSEITATHKIGARVVNNSRSWKVDSKTQFKGINEKSRERKAKCDQNTTNPCGRAIGYAVAILFKIWLWWFKKATIRV